MNRDFFQAALLLGTLALFGSGCAMSIRLPANRFDSPEAMGGLTRFKVEAAYQRVSDIELTPDYRTTAIAINDPKIDPESGLLAGVGVGLLDRLDVGYRFPGQFQAKYQFLGSPRTTATAGNFSLAATAALGFSKESEAGAPSGSSVVRKASLSEKTYDGAIIVGFRIHDRVLLYAGPFFTMSDFSTSYDSGNGSVTSLRGWAKSKGVNLGVELKTNSIYTAVEIAMAEAQLNNAKEQVVVGGIRVSFEGGI